MNDNKETWDEFEHSKTETLIRAAQSQAAYEAWIIEARERGRRERRWRRISMIVGIMMAVVVILSLIVLVNYATSAPMPQPGPQFEPAPAKSFLELAQERCEQSGGFWFDSEDDSEDKSKKIVGCLWAVPKDMK